jgi:superfamily II DNA or RNA helicase
MSTNTRRLALARLQAPTDSSPLLVVATGPFIGEGFDCPMLDALFLAAPIAFKGRLVQYVGRILRPHPGKSTAEVYDYHDIETASSPHRWPNARRATPASASPTPTQQHPGHDQLAQDVGCSGSA